MIFTNAHIFTFIKPFTLNATELNEFISTLKFAPLMSTEFSHFGFVSPIKGGLNLVHEANGNLLVCARKEKKAIPPKALKRLVEDRVEELNLTQAFSVNKKQRAEIKEDIEIELLPNVISSIEDTYAYINAESNTIVINTSSRGKAEDVLALLRKAIGTLPVTSVSTEKEPSEVMTSWVADLFGPEAPLGGCIGNRFSFGLEAHFSGLGDDVATAIVKNQEMYSPEVNVHLDAEQYITKLALNYVKSMSFMLHDDLSIKRIKFEGIFEEENYDDDAAKFDGEYILMAGELNNMITDLHSEFGVSATDSLEA
jgi:recombination associated protein RdgC